MLSIDYSRAVESSDSPMSTNASSAAGMAAGAKLLTSHAAPSATGQTSQALERDYDVAAIFAYYQRRAAYVF
jgi:hypothetical protein